MRWLVRVFASAVVRRVAVVLTMIVLGWVGLGRAEAVDRGEALSACKVGIAALVAARCAEPNNYPAEYKSCRASNESTVENVLDPQTGTWTCNANAQFGGGYFTSQQLVVVEAYDEGCPPDAPWNANLGQCFNPDQCLARNAEPGFKNAAETTRTFESKCVAGCTFAASGPRIKTQLGSDILVSGTFEFTGDVCGVVPDAPPDPKPEPVPPKPQECLPAGAGQTFCVKSNGEQCASASNGTQICWTPGETGEKSSGPTNQQRDSGPQSQPPSNPPALPEELGPAKPPITTTSTVTNNNGTVTVITTTITNRDTVNGTNAGLTNSGQPGDGSGNGSGGADGDDPGEENDGTSAGGATCDAPPATAGGDPLLRSVIEQQWRTRCPHGLNPLPDAATTGATTAGGAHPSIDDVVKDGGVGEAVAQGGDAAGYGMARMCPMADLPQLSLHGHAIDMPFTTMCTWLQMLAAFILLAGHIAWALIITQIGAK